MEKLTDSVVEVREEDLSLGLADRCWSAARIALLLVQKEEKKHFI